MSGVRPRTQLMVDMLLFGLLSTVACSAWIEHTAPQGESHVRFMFHVIHGLAGAAMCLTISVHLISYLPWIRSQLTHLFSSQS